MPQLTASASKITYVWWIKCEACRGLRQRCSDLHAGGVHVVLLASGYKGLGFKSVFKVTDAPQLHSRGYHIKFDLADDPALGFVLPSWVSEPDCSAAGGFQCAAMALHVVNVMRPLWQA